MCDSDVLVCVRVASLSASDVDGGDLRRSVPGVPEGGPAHPGAVGRDDQRVGELRQRRVEAEAHGGAVEQPLQETLAVENQREDHRERAAGAPRGQCDGVIGAARDRIATRCCCPPDN